ncbi:hypothetical protein ACFWCB_11165 [Streptomyces sp. NPDC060048]|uniref:hypothetical protein n=1 Tax=unclassified Streptomyces TaxID=2593676 RepID=UPI0036C6E41E
MRSFSRLPLTAALAALLIAAPAHAASASSGAHRWTAGWATAVQNPSQSWYPPWAEAGFQQQAVRPTVRVGAGGSELRVRLSHAFGTTPLQLTGTTVAISAGGATVQPGTVRTLTFDGSASPSIRPGDRPASDPVRLPVKAGDRLAVTLFFNGSSGSATFHNVAMETTYRADGDHRADVGADVGADAFTRNSSSWYFLEGVAVAGKAAGARRDAPPGKSLESGAPAETRAALNQWSRTTGAYDAVVDFGRVLANPLNPGQLLPAYAGGDGLHPNDAGYRAMADAVYLDSL